VISDCQSGNCATAFKSETTRIVIIIDHDTKVAKTRRITKQRSNKVA
jgi:hypothetical protein